MQICFVETKMKITNLGAYTLLSSDAYADEICYEVFTLSLDLHFYGNGCI